MINETEMYPKELKNKKEICYCCKQIKEGIYIKKDASDCDNVVFVCYSCNHLQSQDKTNKEG